MNIFLQDQPQDQSPFNPDVQLFADGACSGNPGPGGWAFILRHVATGQEQEESGFSPSTTNNRMELQAVIHGLERLTRPASIELLTDSEYVGKGITLWMPNWKEHDWMRREKNRYVLIKNDNLWRHLDQLLQPHHIRFTHTPGHQGHPENERCNSLAIEAYQKFLHK
jgi:ribonuclease HI